ncbi:MBL fold metallo-hydrolase [uncultured Algibacter sp.]|uniref:MBL fold metallo-hydrolase n=1 Tax=uncultured Algibacter sp. TaxID=298659 RepID=UPI00261ADAF6|nr:MBL fold metallo-hydrolase [uncultured Algibacter sp.]
MRSFNILLILVFIFSCSNKKPTINTSEEENIKEKNINSSSIVILGTIQDAGSPQIGCNKSCCVNLFENIDNNRQVVSLGLIDVPNSETYLFEATPDIVKQTKMLTKYETKSNKEIVDGIFLTHAHIGHYTGLMFLGKEAMDAKSIPVYAMPRMKEFLINNGPWSQLIARENILINEMENEKAIQLSSSIQVTPFLVPHRDEYSETVGYKINGPNRSALFIPDIDKWHKWDKDIIEEIKKVDYAFLDATFYSGKEIDNRDISEIPHPFIIESLEEFKNLNSYEKNKVIFIHFNHTNPVINSNSSEAKIVEKLGFRIGKVNDVFDL